MRHRTELCTCAVLALVMLAAPAQAQQTQVQPSAQCQAQAQPSMGRTFLNALVGFLPDTWARLASGGLNLLLGNNSGSTTAATCAPAPTVVVAPAPAPAPAATTPTTPAAPTAIAPAPAVTPAAEATAPTPALAYTVYRVDLNDQVSRAADTDRYRPNEGVAIAVANNVPGIMVVTNIDAAGTRLELDRLRIDSPSTTVFPVAANEIYAVQADSTGDEIIELAFTPCRADDPGTESVAHSVRPQARTRIDATVRTEVLNVLPECVQTLAGAAASDEESVAGRRVSTSARAAVEQAATAGVNVRPFIVRITLRRAAA